LAGFPFYSNKLQGIQAKANKILRACPPSASPLARRAGLCALVANISWFQVLKHLQNICCNINPKITDFFW
jgi:hypothetical protein